MKNCQSICEVLETFCEVSGQRVNKFKSKVYFSPNVMDQIKEDLCSTLGFFPLTI